MELDLILIPGELAVCRLPAGSPAPAWAIGGSFTAVTWTRDETSVVCGAASVPDGVQAEAGWRAIKVAGPLEFALTGVLLSIAEPLARAEIPIFAASTYDTDYVLVREADLAAAISALAAEGHRVGQRG